MMWQANGSGEFCRRGVQERMPSTRWGENRRWPIMMETDYSAARVVPSDNMRIIVLLAHQLAKQYSLHLGVVIHCYRMLEHIHTRIEEQ